MTPLQRLDHLLASIAEESGEVAQVACKCIKFGINDSHKKHDYVANIERLRLEFNDLVAVAEMVGIVPDRALIEKKKIRVEKYMRYAQERKAVE